MKQFTITKKEAGQTVFKYIKKNLEGAPLSFIEKIFRKKDVKINKKRVNKNYILEENDCIEIYINDQQYDDFNKIKENGVKLLQMPNIVYEDDNILIVNKPSGLLVHGDKNEKRITLTNMVLSYLNNKGEYDFNSSTFTPSLAHRIDRNTSGLVIFGKNIRSLQALEDLFKDHNNISKFYYALVKGITPNEGEINKPLLKDENNAFVKIVPYSQGGKKAITQYKTIEKFQYCSLVDIKLITGRTHQIRVHFSSINHPLLGDSKYGDFSLNKKFDEEFQYHGQFLHSYKIIFGNITGFLSYLSNKTISCSLPKKETDILEKLRNFKH